VGCQRDLSSSFSGYVATNSGWSKWPRCHGDVRATQLVNFPVLVGGYHQGRRLNKDTPVIGLLTISFECCKKELRFDTSYRQEIYPPRAREARLLPLRAHLLMQNAIPFVDTGPVPI